MKNLHALVLACLAPCLALSVLADAPSPLSPISREGTKNWKDRYDQQVEQLRNNPCGVLFLGDSITDYWDRGGKQAWDKMFKPYHPCNFGISGDQTTNLIYRITHSGMPAQTDPKLCIVMIGTNNTGHFKGGEDPEKRPSASWGWRSTCWCASRTRTYCFWEFSPAAAARKTSCASTMIKSTPL